MLGFTVTLLKTVVEDELLVKIRTGLPTFTFDVFIIPQMCLYLVQQLHFLKSPVCIYTIQILS